ncbi:hypothetical protein Nepgr_027160 [Nepenthes gracilis]|uniref:Uncharacterized protein n=1 Tax=Nepenthes gracilis TaxID=150966 RepID=A0AAD3Y105_NEPGR|nr:hypothetical protein Nepgr_027160 [Nepenthes gracilis]
MLPFLIAVAAACFRLIWLVASWIAASWIAVCALVRPYGMPGWADVVILGIFRNPVPALSLARFGFPMV